MFELITNKFIIILLFITNIANTSTSIGSYIYLPDKLIQEEIPIGSLIAEINDEINSISNVQNNLNDYSLDSNENQHFTFLDDVKSSTENTYFLLDSVTGRVTSKRYLDRESMCINKHCANSCYFEDLPIQSTSNNNSSSSLNQTTNTLTNNLGNCLINLKILIIPTYNIASLNIVIQDINDNKPQFKIDTIEQSIPENVPIGYKIPLDLAYDPDIGLNSIQSYTLDQQTTPFQLIQILNESILSLVVRQTLDRETTLQYNLTIMACDGGRPTNCGQLKIILNIIDINDNNPIFEKDYYSFQVVENQPANSKIGKIKATDLDYGLNSKIKYKLINSPSDCFDLDSDTGELRLTRPLDYEKEQHFSFNIEARDSGVGSLPAYATIEIIVLDLNDNAPEISVSFLNTFHRNSSNQDIKDSNTYNTSNINVYLNENIEPNKFIAHVSVSDRDLSENNRLEWKVYVNKKELRLPSVLIKEETDDNLLKLNKLNSNSFTISTGPRSNILFDRETFKSINVSIMSTDLSNSAYYNFSLILLDENDNGPIFERKFYDLNINENNYLDQLIHRFNAIDPDLDENGQVFYSLEPVVKNNITIDFIYIEPLTGYLRASKVFDREQTSYYDFLVVARDNAKQIENRKISKVKCRLNIIDLNDNKPNIFYNSTALPYREYSNRTTLSLRLDENISPMTQLVKFHCDDADSDENGQTKFILLNSVGDTNNFYSSDENFNEIVPFKITQDGKFYVSKRLDREFQDFYEMTILCHDNASRINRLNTSLNLIIRINDINDNCPRNLFKSDQKFKVNFINKDLITINESLFSEFYTDDDIGRNAQLKFDIETHSDLFEFEINETGSSTPVVYNIKLLFKNQSYIDLNNVKLGRYVIKIKISDLGNPCCIKDDVFILYIGDRNSSNQTQVIELINSVKYAFDQDMMPIYMNDQDDFHTSQETDYEMNKSPENFNFNYTTDSSSENLRSFPIYSLKKNDYIVLIGLLASLILVGSILSFIGLIFFCKNMRRQKRRMCKKSIDLIKVRNYRESELNSSSSNGSSSNNDDENLSEQNNLLESEINRLSLSLKSSDQSQSADSVISNITFARDSTSSSNSSQVGENLNNLSNNLQNVNIRDFYQQPKRNVNILSSRLYEDNSNILRIQNKKLIENNYSQLNQIRNQTFLSSFPQRPKTSISTDKQRIYIPSQSNSLVYSASETPSSSESGDIIVVPTASSSGASTASSDLSEQLNNYTRLSGTLQESSIVGNRRPLSHLADKDDYDLDNQDEEESNCLYIQKSGYFSTNSNEISSFNKNKYKLSLNNSHNTNTNNHFLRSSAV